MAPNFLIMSSKWWPLISHHVIKGSQFITVSSRGPVVQYVNNLQILQNRLARVLVSADIRARIVDLMNTLNWSKFDQRWKLHLLLTTFNCLKGDAPVYLSSQFSFATHSHHTRGQTFNTLIVPSWKNNLEKEHFISGQASYGTIYETIYAIIINQWACILLKKFWLLYDELYCVSNVYFIYLNFIAFLKG